MTEAKAEPKAVRRDARDNAAKLRAAALEIFLTTGLDASLGEIARAAGVSIGTLYHRFGSREGLIDAVMPDIAARKLQTLGTSVQAKETARERLETFVHAMIDIQVADPALNDAFLRRYPDALALQGECDRAAALGRDLVRAAHDEGSLSSSFTEDDLFCLLWLAGAASRAPAAPEGWRQVLDRALESAWTAPR
ncbi:TetR family transcriptional regulator [Pseudofrankia sp. EUN1h]|nr:TetR family transcriptional regulator [Pseudofrankia sp. EUN1h]